MISSSDPEAVVLLRVMTEFTFVLRFHVLNNLLKYCKSISDYLQTDDLDLVVALIFDMKIKDQDMPNNEKFWTIWEQSSEFWEKHQTSGLSTQDDLSVQPCKTKVPHKLVGSPMNSFIRVADSVGDTLKTDLHVNFCFTVSNDIIFVIGLMADQLLSWKELLQGFRLTRERPSSERISRNLWTEWQRLPDNDDEGE